MTHTCLKTSLLTLALGLSLSPNIWAQDNASGDSEKNTEKKDNSQIESAIEKPLPPSQQSPGIFVPSEEISEDLPVSYPVDI